MEAFNARMSCYRRNDSRFLVGCKTFDRPTKGGHRIVKIGYQIDERFNARMSCWTIRGFWWVEHSLIPAMPERSQRQVKASAYFNLPINRIGLSFSSILFFKSMNCSLFDIFKSSFSSAFLISSSIFIACIG